MRIKLVELENLLVREVRRLKFDQGRRAEVAELVLDDVLDRFSRTFVLARGVQYSVFFKASPWRTSSPPCAP